MQMTKQCDTRPSGYVVPAAIDRARRRRDLVAALRIIALCLVGSLATWLLLAPRDAGAAPVLPDFGAATFLPGALVDNPFFPLTGAGTRVYEGEKEDGGEIVTERFELTTLGPGPTILGVGTTILFDRAIEGGLIVEETRDYYAQDTAGNVWYFGEDVTNFIYDGDDNLIETNADSSWIGGVNGALPGFIMPADLSVGFNYYQEFAAADDALDQATTAFVGNLISIGFGDFTDVLQVLETSELDPDAREFKYYAPGIGLIMAEEGLSEAFDDPEITLTLIDIRPIPEPGTLGLLLGGLGVFTLLAARRRRTGAVRA